MTQRNPRLTRPTLLVLELLLQGRPMYGFELMKRTGLQSGTLYPILARLREAGWVVGMPEEIDPSKEERPARTYYKLTEQGGTAARAAIHSLTRAPSGVRIAWNHS